MAKVDKKKFKELVLYVSSKSADDNKFGSIKLNKIVAYAEMRHFALTGRSITNASYMKQRLGVVARCMKPNMDELAKDRELVIVEKERHGQFAKVPTAVRQADINVFTASEIEAVDSIIAAFKDSNGTDTSEISHMITPNWEYLPIGTEIPISTLLYPSRYTPSLEEVGHFKQLLRETDWGRKVMELNATA